MATGTDRLASFYRRPTEPSRGWWSWVTTVDHKRIGVMYGVTAFIFFLIGGLEAVVIRLQLATPNGQVIDSDTYSQMFTMHGTTMIFLVVMPMSAAFFNYFIPLMIGARDVAFPRLNAFSYWVFLLGGLFLTSSFFLGGAPDAGWFAYANLTRPEYSPGHGMDFWVLGLQILGVASIASSANFIATIINMRAPGMSLMRMPVFIWMTLVVAFLTLFAMPIIAVALFQLMFDRIFGAHFFNPAMGADPVLWQHMFWLFGHPEVYILILPAMGIVSEVLPTFSRKPLFGYPAIVFSGIAIGFMGWGVWAHHMFAVGLGPVANSAFAISTMFIAVPTGVKIFNWMATTWGGQLRFPTPMLFAVGFIAMFIVGGLSGVTHAIVPSTWQQTDTYYIIAHLHYVLFGGAILGLFSGIYYWWPKITGRLLDEKIGKLHFWLMIIGMNLTFGPMHVVGMQGMPRRTYRYEAGYGFEVWNLIMTMGALLIAVSVLVFIVNVLITRKRGEIASDDPWDGRTLEWSISSPPPAYNFATVPEVHARDDFWHRKYAEDESGRAIPVPAGGAGDGDDASRELDRAQEHVADQASHIHMPKPSYFPLVASLGLPIMAYGVMYLSVPGIVAGLVITLAGFYGWVLEPGE